MSFFATFHYVLAEDSVLKDALFQEIEFSCLELTCLFACSDLSLARSNCGDTLSSTGHHAHICSSHIELINACVLHHGFRFRKVELLGFWVHRDLSVTVVHIYAAAALFVYVLRSFKHFLVEINETCV